MSDTPFCDKVASALAAAPGNTFQDRDAWEKTARQFERELTRMRAALDPFARLARLNAPLNLPPDKPVRDFAPGAWPTLADCQRADDALSEKPDA